MLSRNVLATSLVFIFLRACFASPQPQTTVSLELGVVDSDSSDSSDDDFVAAGEIVGAGSDGTTYVVSVVQTYTDDDSGSLTVDAQTFTAVQDATHVSLIAVQTANSISISDSFVCNFDNSGNAVCTEAFAENDSYATTTESFTTSGSIDAVAVAVSTASDAKISSGSSTASSASSTTSSGAETLVASGFASVAATFFGLVLLL